ncbi:GSCFA domain-containing protein [Azospirillum argentinense]|uniref:GSCFA domain-containing protein n=1 Tax=Azospirillum brasilense TaxID=192 RepID=A0A4D8Q1G7_AZOBR|nr:GSCFA domain-containing protein [Azospirillum argentinense]QCO03965.1 hypothetical protein D3867_18425 [Azospirillum argentinense]
MLDRRDHAKKFSQAVSLFYNGDCVKAADLLSEIISDKPEDKDLLVRASNAMHSIEKYIVDNVKNAIFGKNIEKACENLLILSRHWVNSWNFFSLCREIHVGGDQEKARPFFYSMIMSESRWSGNAHFYVAQSYVSEEAYDKAESHLKKAVQLASKGYDWSEPIHLLGEVLNKLGRHAEGQEYLDHASRLKQTAGLPSYEDGDKIAAGFYKDKLGGENQNSINEDLAPKTVRWPIHILEKVENARGFSAAHIIKGIPLPSKKIKSGHRIVTLGSCFAQNIATAVSKYNLDVFHIAIHEEVNTTYTNDAFFDWILDIECDLSELFDRLFGLEKKEIFKNYLKSSDFIIFTVGVAPGIFYRGTKTPVILFDFDMKFVALNQNLFEFRTTTVQENVDNIKRIMEKIRTLNPKSEIIVSLSPVGLMGTLEYNSAIIADCVSKSVLRASIHEIMAAGDHGFYYWPSFEIVRWLGSHLEYPTFGGYDSRHPTRAIIEMATELFITHAGDASLEKREISGLEHASSLR